MVGWERKISRSVHLRGFHVRQVGTCVVQQLMLCKYDKPPSKPVAQQFLNNVGTTVSFLSCLILVKLQRWRDNSSDRSDNPSLPVCSKWGMLTDARWGVLIPVSRASDQAEIQCYKWDSNQQVYSHDSWSETGHGATKVAVQVQKCWFPNKRWNNLLVFSPFSPPCVVYGDKTFHSRELSNLSLGWGNYLSSPLVDRTELAM